MKLFSWLQDHNDPLNSAETEDGQEAAVSPVLQARLNELEQMSVQSVMTPRAVVTALDVDVQLRRVRRLKSAKTAYFPVYKGDLDHVLGWISKQKVLDLLAEANDETQLQLFLRPVGIVREDASVADLADAFLKNASPFLVVQNSQAGTVGLVALADFVELVFGFNMDVAPTTFPPEVAPPLLRSYEL